MAAEGLGEARSGGSDFILMVDVCHFSHCDREPREAIFKVDRLLRLVVSEVSLPGPLVPGVTALHSR